MLIDGLLELEGAPQAEKLAELSQTDAGYARVVSEILGHGGTGAPHSLLETRELIHKQVSVLRGGEPPTARPLHCSVFTVLSPFSSSPAAATVRLGFATVHHKGTAERPKRRHAPGSAGRRATTTDRPCAVYFGVLAVREYKSRALREAELARAAGLRVAAPQIPAQSPLSLQRTEHSAGIDCR